MNTIPCQFRLASLSDAEFVWHILESAIQRRKASGSQQWQDGYPNPKVIAIDISKNAGHVLIENRKVIGYVALMINDEPEYKRLKGEWLTNEDFVVFHRLALAESHLGMGCAKHLFELIEKFAQAHGIRSIKADTNFDNFPMLSLFDKFSYVYCGEVTFRNSPRRAYEKVLNF
jgi:GNAT superfamily N-acetyltransferase